MPKKTHGLSRTPEWAAWRAALRRCTLANDPAYKNYGGRGIRVCARWAADFLHFLADMGKRPTDGHSLDRENNEGHYSCGSCSECIENGWPANCRWATEIEQHSNTRENTFVEFRGERMTIAELTRRAGFGNGNGNLIFDRLARGWSVEDAATIPVKPNTLLPKQFPKEYQAWFAMFTACRNKNDHRYKTVGAMGIIVCDRWLEFGAFLFDVGPRPIDKKFLIRADKSKNYEPGNVRWGTILERNQLSRRCKAVRQ